MIHFDQVLTVLAGENNAGKTNVLEALRLLSSPSDGRRTRYVETDDLRLDAEAFHLEGTYAGLDPCQRGLFFTALSANNADTAILGLTWSPPSGTQRRRPPSSWVGRQRIPDPEPDIRDLVRHVHLPALRDAQRDLASSSPGRIEFLLRHLLDGKEAERDALIATAQAAFDSLLNATPLLQARDRVRAGFKPLADGFVPHEAHLRFADASLGSLARDLRFRLTQAGIDPNRLAQTGLGYSNLLYLASVLVELEAARDAELTLLLVEEPEAHLHPQLQQATLAYLRSKAEESLSRATTPGEHAGQIQVVVSTHSPNLAAAVPIKHLVILRAAAPTATELEVPLQGEAASDMNDGEENRSSPPEEQDGPLSQSAEGTSSPPFDLPTTSAVAVAEMGLAPLVQRKIERYLDVTRSSLVFGRGAILVEGIAEALLLPVFARRVLTSEQQARFRAVSIVAIDGVDFEPYVRLLLTAPHGGGSRIADRVVVITDEDARDVEQEMALNADSGPDDSEPEHDQGDSDGTAPSVPAGEARKRNLNQLAMALDAAQHLTIELTPRTLEASFVDAHVFPAPSSRS